MSSQPSLVTELCDITLISIAAGSYHSAAVDDQGRLFTWGWGVHGQLGLSDIEDEFVPSRGGIRSHDGSNRFALYKQWLLTFFKPVWSSQVCLRNDLLCLILKIAVLSDP